MRRTLLNRFCGQPWLHLTYALGIAMFNIAAWQAIEGAWSVPQLLMAALAVTLPIHVFEELCWPNGFQFMMNKLVQKSPEPLVNPENRLTDMITNLGAELLFIVLILAMPRLTNPLVFAVAFFGIGECVVHTIFGVLSLRAYREKGKRTIYGPGSASAYLCFLPISCCAVHYLVADATFALPDLGLGLLFMAFFMFGMIRLPMIISGRVNNPNYAYESKGYFEKYEA